MKADSIIKEKAMDFAVRIVNLYQYLCTEKKEFVMSKQLLRSGTSIGANINEALQGFSKNDFIYKLSIALKEASETEYWLTLLYKTNYLTKKEFESIKKDNMELLKMLTAIIKTSRATT
jgi:four helix bundle protein